MQSFNVKNFTVVVPGVSLRIAAILIVRAVIAVKKHRQPPQARQVTNEPEASVNCLKQK